MKITPNILSFRYRKNFLINYLKRKKRSSQDKVVKQSHLCCPVCKFDEAELIAEVDRVGVLSDTVVCRQCGFVFNNSFIANPDDFYSCEWGGNRWGDPENNFLNRTNTNSFSWKRFSYVSRKLGESFKDVNTVLEVGCGDGCNLLPYHLIGKRVIGCDFDTRFLAPGRDRGMELIEGDLNSVPIEYKFDLVMLIHSFEHILNLDEIIKQVASRLDFGGLVFVEVPGIVNWNRPRKAKVSAMGLESSNNFMGYLQFQHNYHFDLKHLKYIWEKNGFEMVEGDEWVRAVFRKKEDIKSMDEGGMSKDWDECFQNTREHLEEVEADFLSLSNLTCGVVKRVLRKIC